MKRSRDQLKAELLSEAEEVIYDSTEKTLKFTSQSGLKKAQ